MNRRDLTPDLRLELWRMALQLAVDDVARQEAEGKTFAHPIRAARRIRRDYFVRLVDDDDFRIQQRDRLYGAVPRPPKWPTPRTLDLGPGQYVRFGDWVADGAPDFPDGPHVAAGIRAALHDARGRQLRPTTAIETYPWPSPGPRYVDHDPSPEVGLAIATDLHARLVARATGRHPGRGQREAWAARAVPSGQAAPRE